MRLGIVDWIFLVSIRLLSLSGFRLIQNKRDAPPYPNLDV